MKTYDLSELALRNLRESILRNSLTTIGISVGVASLVAMLALGIGLQQLASRRLARSELFDTVIVTSRRDLRNFNREEEQNGPPAAESPALDEPARQKITQIPNVAEAFPDVRFVTELRYDDKPHLTLVAGLPASSKGSDAFEGMQGAFFSSDVAPEAVLQKPFAEELLGKRPKKGEEDPPVAELAKTLLGKDLVMKYSERIASSDANGKKANASLKPQSHGSLVSAEGTPDDSPESASYSVVSHTQVLKIVGVADLDPESARGMASARVFIPLKLAESLHVIQPNDLRDTTRALSKTPTYARLNVRVLNPARVSDVESAIKKMGFNTFSIVDATRGIRRFFAVLDLFLGIFGSLALAVASIGIVNTLVMAILERRREIGIMKAIGASDIDIKKLFFAEAGVMGIFGGVVGVALGWTIGRIINLGANIYLKRQNFPPEQIWSVPWWLVAGAILFSVIVSLVSGLYPAARAARLDPVQALRYE
jgi:putative ABC transport system permease protein